MKKIKITEFEFETTNKLINNVDTKLKEPEGHKTFQVYSLDEEGKAYDHLASFDTLEEAIKFAKINDTEVVE